MLICSILYQSRAIILSFRTFKVSFFFKLIKFLFWNDYFDGDFVKNLSIFIDNSFFNFLLTTLFINFEEF